MVLYDIVAKEGLERLGILGMLEKGARAIGVGRMELELVPAEPLQTRLGSVLLYKRCRPKRLVLKNSPLLHIAVTGVFIMLRVLLGQPLNCKNM